VGAPRAARRRGQWPVHACVNYRDLMPVPGVEGHVAIPDAVPENDREDEIMDRYFSGEVKREMKRLGGFYKYYCCGREAGTLIPLPAPALAVKLEP
jgi:hypothetical protein